MKTTNLDLSGIGKSITMVTTDGDSTTGILKGVLDGILYLKIGRVRSRDLVLTVELSDIKELTLNQ